MTAGSSSHTFLIGQLAVAKNFDGQGIGSATLVAAFRRIAGMDDRQILGVAVAVDCLDDVAASFYARRGFLQMNSRDPRARMFFPMTDVLDLAGAS